MAGVGFNMNINYNAVMYGVFLDLLGVLWSFIKPILQVMSSLNKVTELKTKNN